jgi:two-component system, response regulator / RNA-binding antiterminator
MHDLTDLRSDEAFTRGSLPRLVLDRDLVIRAANPAYLSAVRATEDIVSLPVFEAFPENPTDPASDGHAVMAASFERVLAQGRAHHLLLQRYDTADAATGEFRERYWVPVNVPVHRDDRVVGVEVRVREVPRPTDAALDAVAALRAALNDGLLVDVAPADDAVHELVSAIGELDRLAREADQLREALTSRATIDQAKGIVMAQRGCTADEAWQWLVRLSNETNVRVAEVAGALVYQVTRQASEPDRAVGAGPAGSC